MKILTSMFLATSVVVVIPITLFFWLANIFIFKTHSHQGAWEPIPPTRWLFALLFPLVLAKYGLARKSLSYSGAVTGVFVGLFLTISNYCFCASLLAFFVTGSRVTKFRSDKKKIQEADFKEGGKRNWLQVICNGGVAAELALIYMIETGWGEFPVDFRHRYNVSWLSMAVMGTLAACNGDTFASEIGSVIGIGNPRLITNFSQVPRGTNGAISIVGTLSSILGGLIVGTIYYVALTLSASEVSLRQAPDQRPLILVGGLCGLVGSLVDSFLGATVQYSGLDENTKCVVELPGPDVKDISGSPILDNHSVNLVMSMLMALISPKIAFFVWSYFS